MCVCVTETRRLNDGQKCVLQRRPGILGGLASSDGQTHVQNEEQERLFAEARARSLNFSLASLPSCDLPAHVQPSAPQAAAALAAPAPAAPPNPFATAAGAPQSASGAIAAVGAASALAAPEGGAGGGDSAAIAAPGVDGGS